MFSRRFKPIFVIVVIAAVAIGSGFGYLRSRSDLRVSKLRLCLSRNFANAFPILAIELGLFKERGIDLDLRLEPLGKVCAERLEHGQVDVAMAYNTPVVNHLQRGARWSILTELHSSTRNTSIVYSRHSQIHKADDLVGKRLAMIPGTNAEFLLRLICMANEFDCRRIQLLNSSLEEMPRQLKERKADAAIIWEPHLSRILNASPGEFGIFLSSFYTEFSVLAAEQDFVRSNPDLVRRFLEALSESQTHYFENEKASRALVIKSLGMSEADVSGPQWDKIHLSLGLSSVLRTMMNQEYQLVGADHGTGRNVAFEMDEHLEPKFLKAILPESVTYQ